jgi:hypothetical protein
VLTEAITALGLGLAVPVALAAPANPGDTVYCPPVGIVCYVGANTPGDAGPVPPQESETVIPAAATPTCRVQDTSDEVPCSHPVFGSWSNAESCYFERVEPPPPPTVPAWGGNYPDGAIYQTTCFGFSGTGGGWVWRATPPLGYGDSGVSVEALAAQAVERLPLAGPDIGLAPDPAKVGLVGLPVWMWTEVTPSTWGPVSATASVPGLSVTATAQADRVVWDMGDGQSVTCDGPGTPYDEHSGVTVPPTCGHLYERASAAEPGGAYTVTATTTWRIEWSGGGSSGELTQTRESSVRVRIGELQVLVT